MKKYYFIFAAATAFLAACDNEDNSLNEQPQQAVVTYIQAEANEGATTRGSVDGSTAAFTWNTGDKIAVYADGYKISDALESTYNNTNAATFAFSGTNAVTEANRSNFAIYPASLVWDGTSIRSGSATDYTSTSLKLTLPASYTLEEVQNDVSPTPMIATNAPDGNLSFKALCPLLRVTVNNIPKQTKRIEFDFNGKKVQGEFTLTSVDAGTTAIATSATDDTDDIITITMASNTTWHDNLVVNLPVPTGTYGDITITAYDATSGGNKLLSTKKPIKSTGWNPTRKASRMMSATLPVFTVSYDYKKVIFSPGNLQAYNATANSASGWVWSFAPNQWDYIGGRNSNNNTGTVTCNNNMTTDGKITVSGTVDLFSWSTSSSYYGITSAYYGASMFNGSFLDWGSLVIGSYAASTWRTLSGGSQGEWRYLFKSRAASTVNGVTNARFAKAMVNSIHGVILFPDSYTHPAGVTAPVGINNAEENTGWNGNDYSTADWNQMEAAGAVFLPAGGSRAQENVISSGTAGNYWASTTNGDYAQYISFWSTNLSPESSQQRYTGCSIRLVRDVNGD